MQSNPISLNTWTEVLRFAVASIVASGTAGGIALAIINAVLKRKKRSVVNAELHESEARSAKVFAEARSIELQTDIAQSDAVGRIVQKLTFAHLANVKLHEQVERLENENERYETQMRRAKALLKLHNIKFDEEI